MRKVSLWIRRARNARLVTVTVVAVEAHGMMTVTPVRTGSR